MVGWHHRLDGHEFEQPPGAGEGQGGLGAAVRGVAESDWTESSCLSLWESVVLPVLAARWPHSIHLMSIHSSPLGSVNPTHQEPSMLLLGMGLHAAPSTPTNIKHALSKLLLDHPTPALLSDWALAVWWLLGGRTGWGVTPPFRGYLLSCEFVSPHGDAVDELHGTPEPVEFHALVHVHDTVGRWRAPPDRVLQVAPDAGQDDLKHGQSTA